MNALPQPPFSDYQPPRQPVRWPRQRLSKLKALIWIVGLLCGLLLIVIVVMALALRSQRVHTYVLQKTQQKASDALGSKVGLQNFRLSWLGAGPAVELYGVVVHGAPPDADPPLLEVDSIRLQITISSFLHRSWYVNDLRIEHPVARLLVDRNGHSNLPQSQSSNSSGNNKEIFDIGIRHLLVEKGEIYYNDKKGDLAADVKDLSLHSAFDASQVRYSGTLAYENGHIQWAHSVPVIHSLDAHFMATPEEFSIDSSVLKTPHSHLTLLAQVRNYAQPKIHASYQALIDAGELRRTLNDPSMPTGIIALSGEVDSESVPNRPILLTTKINGHVSSSELRIPYRQATATIRNLGANYGMADGNASVKDVRAALLGGAVAGTLLVRDLSGATNSHLEMKVSGISISQIQALLGPPPNQAPTVRGSLNGNADARWGKTFANVIASANATLQGSMQTGHGGPETPISGNVHAEYAGAQQRLSLRQSYLRTPQTSVNINGTVSNHSSLQVRADTQELHELEILAAGLEPSGSVPLNLHGQATLNATITGSTKNPQIQSQLSAANMQVRGTTWKSLHARLTANPSFIQIEDGELTPATKGRITFNAKSALQQWSPAASSRFDVRLAASGLNVAELAKAAGLTTAVSGTLSANVQGSGTQLSPLGEGKIELTGAKIGDEPLRTLSLGFQADGNSVNAKLDASAPAGKARAEVYYEPKRKSYRASVRAAGIKLEELATLKDRNVPLNGTLNVTADGSGTLQDPGLTASIEAPNLQIRDQVIRGLKLDTQVANHQAKFDLNSQLLETHASGHGTIQLTGDYVADASFDTQAIPLEPLVAMYAPQQAADLAGQTEVHATLRGPLKNKTALEAHVVVPKFALKYKNTIDLAAAAPIRADYVNGALDVKRSVIRGTGTELNFQAHVPAAKDAPVSLLLQGTIDLRLAQMISPDVTSNGELRFDIDSFGQRSNPDVQGQVRIVNASFAEAGVPLGLRNGNGVITLTRDRLDVTEFHGDVGGGSVTARGGVIYRPSIQFDLGMKMDRVRALYQQSIRTTLGSNLSLSGTYDSALLQGQVNVEDLSFTSKFDLMDFTNEVGGGETTPPPTGGFSERLKLQVAIQTPGGINLTSRTLSMAGQANLQIRGTAAQPVVLGRINVSDGELIFSGNRYLVQGGTIDFRNPSRTEPVVDVSANTTIQQYEIQMRFWGPTDHLHTNYSSVPALPPADIINLVAFGKTSEAAAANPTPPGALGAESVVASQVSSQVTSRVEKIAGISQLSIDPQFGSGQQNPGARVAVQQHVTGKIFVTFSTDVTSTQQQAVKVEYHASPKSSFTVFRDQNGGFSFQTSFTKAW